LVVSGMGTMLTRSTEEREVEDYRGWPLRQRLELLAFEARLARDATIPIQKP
jgi:hypothetical protein